VANVFLGQLLKCSKAKVKTSFHITDITRPYCILKAWLHPCPGAQGLADWLFKLVSPG